MSLCDLMAEAEAEERREREQAKVATPRKASMERLAPGQSGAIERCSPHVTSEQSAFCVHLVEILVII